MTPKRLSIVITLFYTLLTDAGLNSQNNVFGEGPVNWETRKPYEIPVEIAKYTTSDLVILSDLTQIYFCTISSERLVRNIKYKINTVKGLERLKHYTMPESFDMGFDSEIYIQGRRSRIKRPILKDQKIKVFGARKFSNQRWSNVSVKDRYERQRLIQTDGSFLEEDVFIFDLGSIAVGDVVELYYELSFNASYGSNVFYFHSVYPKLNCEYDFIYRQDKSLEDVSYFLPVNIDPSRIYTSKVNYEGYHLVTTKIQLADLQPNHYPLNCNAYIKMPHVCTDFNYYRTMVKYEDKQYYFTKTSRAKNFEWPNYHDTSVKEMPRIYDKHFTAIKKCVATLPYSGSDSQNLQLMKAFCDSINNYRYITPNQLFYNESQLYELPVGEHLLKRRLTGHTLRKIYSDIFRESHLFYYLVNIQDKRLGEHQNKQRAHVAYERNLFAIPIDSQFVFLMPRNDGLKYHLDELPFYYEGANAALIPTNFQQETKNKGGKGFRLIKTKQTSCTDNVRQESATVKISLDSLTARLIIQESLSGQFSTLLRPVYLSDNIDSTVSPNYFKTCLDKPYSSQKKIKLVSTSTKAPFPYTFDCSAKIKRRDTSQLDLNNWFSFTLTKQIIPVQPTYDYYFDFTLSDFYRLQLDFDKPVQLKNRAGFNKKIDNTYFFLESGSDILAENRFVLTVILKIKQTKIPAEEAHLLTDFIEQLEQLNQFKLEFTKQPTRKN